MVARDRQHEKKKKKKKKYKKKKKKYKKNLLLLIYGWHPWLKSRHKSVMDKSVKSIQELRTRRLGRILSQAAL